MRYVFSLAAALVATAGVVRPASAQLTVTAPVSSATRARISSGLASGVERFHKDYIVDPPLLTVD